MTLFDESGLLAMERARWAQMRRLFVDHGVAHPDVVAALRAIPKPQASAPEGVAIINIHGPISKGASFFSELFGFATLDRIKAQVLDAASDSSIRGLVLHIDSPGGGVYGLDETFDTIAAVAKRKPVVAFSDGLMASAAYWVGAAASHIVVTPSAELGSIGVFAVHFDESEAFKKEGVAPTLIKAGKYKAEAHPFGPLSEDDHAAIQARVDATYGRFTRAVAKGRGVSAEFARGPAFGEGRVRMASDAVAAGMADEVGTYEDALRYLAATPSATRTAARAAIDSERLMWAVELAQLDC